jgi:NhaP-type Na+/H+ or K+/H+ antiporter
MKWFHLAVGTAVFIAFAVTGKYMRVDFPDKDVIPQDLRLLMRSRHIYILFNSLIHLVLGAYLVLRPIVLQKALQITGSILLTVASVLLVRAWYVETYDLQHFTDASRWGIYTTLTAVGLHLIGGVVITRSARKSADADQ